MQLAGDQDVLELAITGFVSYRLSYLARKKGDIRRGVGY